MSNVVVHTLRALQDNFIYVLNFSRLSGENFTCVIDPGEAEPVIRFLHQNSLALNAILCTHHHHDHIDGVSELVQRFHCPVYCSQIDLTRIPCATQGLRDGEILTLTPQVSESQVQVISVPGHTQGQIVYWLSAAKVIFVGDTLFSAGCGRLFEGTAEQMYSSLQRLKVLPLETKIYFGHEYTVKNLQFARRVDPNNVDLSLALERAQSTIYSGLDTTPSTIAHEQCINLFLRAKNLAEFTNLRLQRDQF